MTPETKIKSQIKGYLKIKGIFYWSNLAGIGSYKGLPDLFAVRDGKIFGIEVKAKNGILSAYQAQFHEDLVAAGGTYILARSVEDVMKYI